jgi:hypothetical protein
MVGRRGFIVILVAIAASVYSASQALSLVLLPNDLVAQQFVVQYNNEQYSSSPPAIAENAQQHFNFTVNPLFQKQYNIIDAGDPEERCKRYYFKYQKGQRRRRIFFGAMVADEEFDVIRMHAAEVYGLYHYVALVESNATHSATHTRPLRFSGVDTEGNNLIYSGIFGPRTTVHLDLYLNDAFGAKEINREEIQREEILKRWKKAGMREDDVGLMADMDETFTRDFLLAIQTCDIKVFRPGQNCHTPRVLPISLVFESSPECISKAMWFHPDVIIGECIEGIGDPTGRPKPERLFLGIHGERKPEWGANSEKDYPAEVIAKGRYPLANGADFRTGVRNHGVQRMQHEKPYPFETFYVTAYHFHNFFPNRETLRHKYLTYAHPYGGVVRKRLSEIHKDDLDMMVRCVHNLPNSANPDFKGRHEGGYADYEGSKPIFFANAAYRKARHELVKRMVEEDEKIMGKFYTENGTIIPCTTSC